MQVAILSDIHSNVFALDAVLKEVKKKGIEQLIVLGDIFGYYPWAPETFNLLQPFLQNSFFIKGNHDQLLLDEFPPYPEPSYWALAKHNRKALSEKNEAALHWLESLPFSREIKIAGVNVYCFHGSPSDSVNGRHYPDSEIDQNEFAGLNGVVLLGHTHYPVLKKIGNVTTVFNPGSVGQPRDGNPMPSWGIIDFNSMKYQHIRTEYDYCVPVNILTSMNWDKRAIAALQKSHKGKL